MNVNDTFVDKIINAFAGINDYFALKNRDWRVQNNTNEGTNLVYLPGYSYKGLATSFTKVTLVIIGVFVITLILNLLGIVPIVIWIGFLSASLILGLMDLPMYFMVVYPDVIGEKIKNNPASTKVKAEVVKIKRTYFPFHMDVRGLTTVKSSNSFPYVIIAKWKDSNKGDVYVKSLILANNPAEKFPIGSNISVYIDPNNYKHYYVDTESLF